MYSWETASSSDTLQSFVKKQGRIIYPKCKPRHTGKDLCKVLHQTRWYTDQHIKNHDCFHARDFSRYAATCAQISQISIKINIENCFLIAEKTLMTYTCFMHQGTRQEFKNIKLWTGGTVVKVRKLSREYVLFCSCTSKPFCSELGCCTECWRIKAFFCPLRCRDCLPFPLSTERFLQCAGVLCKRESILLFSFPGWKTAG